MQLKFTFLVTFRSLNALIRHAYMMEDAASSTLSFVAFIFPFTFC